MKPSRQFKENVLVVGFFLLSVAVVVILMMGIGRCGRAKRTSTPVTEQIGE